MVRKIAVPSVVVLALALGAARLSAQEAAQQAAAPSTSWMAPLSAGETLAFPAMDERVPRPDAFLGYPLGSRFTHWDRIVAYLQAVAAASPRVKMWEYGRTYEGRPLELIAVSSPENIQRLEEIRQEHQRLADTTGLSAAERDSLAKRLPLVVWLAYGVHGNEASSAEAAMGAAYVLAAGQGDIPQVLANMIVLIDPLSNPDGRERYVSGYEQRRGAQPNPRRDAAEHVEPWPGGRQNHYLIDLNRDWAWASQLETRHRIAAYRSWEPQVYVDFHEMNSESSYFFPPAAEPIHPQIDRRVVSWLETFGRGNAEMFDRLGWIYFKGESYDLFYPGYGDSYPSLRGAVGMTYEMAGGGRGGLALRLSDGTLLTLADRTARHLTTSLATVRTAAANGRRLLEDFVANRLKAAADPRAYVWAGDQPEARALADLLVLHGIQVQQTTQALEMPVRSLVGRLSAEGDAASPRRFAAGAYVVSTTQPLGNLIEALLERESPMSEGFVDRQRRRLEQNQSPQFYDITAWSLPLAFHVDTWVAATVPGGLRPLPEVQGGIRGSERGEGDLGVLVPPQGIASYRLAAELQRRGIVHRVAMGKLSGQGVEFPAGTLFIPRRGNPDGLRGTLGALLAENRLEARAIDSSFTLTGMSLGSNDMERIRSARVGLVGGEGIDPTSFGFLWHLLDQQIGVDHDRLDLSALGQVDLSEIDVLVLPSGAYEEQVGERTREALNGWVRGGGVLVAIGDSIGWLQKHEMTSIKSWQAPGGGAEESEESRQAEDPESEMTPVERSLASRPIFTPGAILSTRMQPNHPLTLGLGSSPAVLFEGSTVLKPTGDPRKDVLLAADDDPVLAGFAWPEASERLAGSLLVGMETRGNGGVVLFSQEPAFRLFWRATAPILLNALLYGPSTGVGARF